MIGADIGPDVNSATFPVHGARNRKGCTEVAKRKAPDLFVQVRGSETLDINYSNSMVAGGLLVMSYATRLMPGTSATMRPEMRASTS